MRRAELEVLDREIDAEIGRIIKNQVILRDTHGELRDYERSQPEKHFIDSDAFGEASSSGRTFQFGDVTIKVRKLNRRGINARDNKGTDLLYEIEHVKFCLIQYKGIYGQSRVLRDGLQLDELVDNGASDCDSPLGSIPICGSWFTIVGNRRHYHMAWAAKKLFFDHKSHGAGAFENNISQDAFDDAFA